MTEAVLSRNSISIRVPEKAVRRLVEGAWAMNALQTRMKITDAPVFMRALVNALNAEDEQGTTLIHRMFDAAINEALEQGAEGIEDHKIQDV